MTKIEGVPDGYELLRIGQPQVGETSIDCEGVVTNRRHNWLSVNLPIVRKIEPPKPVEPPQGYRLLGQDESIATGDILCASDGNSVSVHSTIGQVVRNVELYPDQFFARKIEPKVRPMTRSEFLAAWKQRGFCPLIDHEDDIDIVLGVIDEPTEFDPEIVNTDKHGWLSLDVLSGFKFASDETYLTVEE